jgi:uncharacterized protein YecE (DUF72 family)
MEAIYPKVGCCGFPLKKPEFARRFPVAEVQQTFYQPPKKLETLKRWRAEVRPEFEYTLKAWQLITHPATSPTYRRVTTRLTKDELEHCGSFQDSLIVHEAWLNTKTCAQALEAKLILFQCPRSFAPTLQNISQMKKFFSKVKREDLTFLWDPRGYWSEEVIEKLCRELDLIHAVDPFLNYTVTPEFVYYRLHGGKDFKHVFSEKQMRNLLNIIPAGKPSYIMFNNIAMLENATRFQEMAETLKHTQELELH